jgi:hypothetical protein
LQRFRFDSAVRAGAFTDPSRAETAAQDRLTCAAQPVETLAAAEFVAVLAKTLAEVGIASLSLHRKKACFQGLSQ